MVRARRIAVQWLVTAVVATAASPRAQGPLEAPRPLAPEALRAAGIAPAKPRGPIARIDCDADPSRGFVATSVPVVDAAPESEWSFAEAAGGRRLVVLGGGIQTSLDVWVIDRVTGASVHLPTQGGRRMPSRFNGGAGPWPLLEGGELILLAFERNGATQFRALDGSGAELAAIELAGEVAAFHVTPQAAEHRVRVRFTGSAEVVEFHHPRAPRLEVDVAAVDFGESPLGAPRERSVTLRNAGRSRLEVRLELAGGSPFTAAEERLAIDPGAAAPLAVRFVPVALGAAEQRLTLHAEGAVPRVVVLLQGRGVDAATTSPDVPFAPAPPATGRSEAARGEPRRRAEPAATAGGAASQRAPAQVLAPLPALPLLTADDSEVVVQAEPGEDVLLLVVAQDGFGRPARVLRCWRGRTRWDGTLRVPRREFGEGDAELDLFALVDRDGVRMSARFTLPAR